MKDEATLRLNNLPTLDIPYDDRNFLPIAYGSNHSASQLNLALNETTNQNLTPAQRLLLIWHNRFGHRAFPFIQRLFRREPFSTTKFLEAGRCDIPICSTCQLAKAHRTPTKGKVHIVDKNVDGNIRNNYLRPGAGVSVDHFES